MNGEVFHKIVEPYLLAVALVVAILAVTAVLLRRDGRKAQEREGDATGARRSDA